MVESHHSSKNRKNDVIELFLTTAIDRFYCYKRDEILNSRNRGLFLEIMGNSHQSGNLLVDEIELEAQIILFYGSHGRYERFDRIFKLFLDT